MQKVLETNRPALNWANDCTSSSLAIISIRAIIRPTASVNTGAYQSCLIRLRVSSLISPVIALDALGRQSPARLLDLPLMHSSVTEQVELRLQQESRFASSG
jgi:hypothetical protein